MPALSLYRLVNLGKIFYLFVSKFPLYILKIILVSNSEGCNESYTS